MGVTAKTKLGVDITSAELTESSKVDGVSLISHTSKKVTKVYQRT